MSKDTLTAKQQAFVDEYLIDMNASAAALRAGYSERTAGAIGHENLEKPKIAAAIREAQKQRSERTQITADEVVTELARIGLFDVRRLFTDSGCLKNPDQWDDMTAAAVASVEVVVRPTGFKDEFDNPEVEHVHKIKLWDKVSVLEKLGKHLGIFNDSKKFKFTGPNDEPVKNITVEFV